MVKFQILIDTEDKVREFLRKINTLDGDYDLETPHAVVDAKSMLGIFTLDLAKPVRLSVHREDLADKAAEVLSDFIV